MNLNKLNGWQRIFVFVVLFLYLPITILATTLIEQGLGWHFSEKQLDNKIAEFVLKEKVPFSITLQSKETTSYKNAKPAEKITNFQHVQIISSDKSKEYVATFLYDEKDVKEFEEDKNVLKTLNFLSEIIVKKSGGFNHEVQRG